jgi:hypothetical protein
MALGRGLEGFRMRALWRVEIRLEGRVFWRAEGLPVGYFYGSDYLGGVESAAAPLAGKMPARAGGRPALPRKIYKRRSRACIRLDT